LSTLVSGSIMHRTTYISILPYVFITWCLIRSRTDFEWWRLKNAADIVATLLMWSSWMLRHVIWSRNQRSAGTR
jgi:hypothetical protein